MQLMMSLSDSLFKPAHPKPGGLQVTAKGHPPLSLTLRTPVHPLSWGHGPCLLTPVHTLSWFGNLWCLCHWLWLPQSD